MVSHLFFLFEMNFRQTKYRDNEHIEVINLISLGEQQTMSNFSPHIPPVLVSFAMFHNRGLERVYRKTLDGIQVRKSKFLNNMVEQDHRFIKKRIRTRLGFKTFHSARIVLAGIEVLHLILKNAVIRPYFIKIPLMPAGLSFHPRQLPIFSNSHWINH
jgi:hypothetical protein